MSKTRTAVLVIQAGKRARVINRATPVQVEIMTDHKSGDYIVWVNGDPVGPYPATELDAILDGIEQSARALIGTA